MVKPSIAASRVLVSAGRIWPLSITQQAFQRLKGHIVPQDQEDQEGYLVYYPDGYTSWSPKSVFEQAYREISESEKALIC
jgi:hypothetical protein